MTAVNAAPCPCWDAPRLHEGHCCFDGPPEAYGLGKPLLCGHTEPAPWTEPDLFEVCS